MAGHAGKRRAGGSLLQAPPTTIRNSAIGRLLRRIPCAIRCITGRIWN